VLCPETAQRWSHYSSPHFGHAQIALGLVVGKRNPQVDKPRQHLIGPLKQGIQQILGLALFVPPFAFFTISSSQKRLQVASSVPRRAQARF
jgi:hypothetical protein